MSIAHIEYYIPKKNLEITEIINRINSQQLPKDFTTKSEYELFVKSVLNVDSVRIESELEAHEMIENVLVKSIDEKNINPEDIDLIIFVPASYQRRFENIGQYLQYKCGMHNAHTIELSGNDCVNIEMALKIATGLLNGLNLYNNILIVGAAKIDHIASRIIGNYGIYGDAAGIILLNKEGDKATCQDVVNYCDGMQYESMVSQVPVLKHCKYLLKSLNQLTQNNSLEKEAIHDIIIQNANPLLVKQCLNSRGYDEENIFTNNLTKYGHLNQLDYLVNLSDLIHLKKEDETRNIISLGFGWAGSYVSSFLTY